MHNLAVNWMLSSSRSVGRSTTILVFKGVTEVTHSRGEILAGLTWARARVDLEALDSTRACRALRGIDDFPIPFYSVDLIR